MHEKNRPKKSGPEGLAFEEAMSRLEKTVEQLEKDDISLDDSLRLFEEGVALIRICDTHLRNAKGRVSELLKNEKGGYVEKVLGGTLDDFISGEDGNG